MELDPTASARIAAHLTELPATASAPESVHLIPGGRFFGRDGRGPYVLDAAAVKRQFDAHGMPLAIDYEHQSIHTADNG
jgi:phage I-like protein